MNSIPNRHIGKQSSDENENRVFGSLELLTRHEQLLMHGPGQGKNQGWGRKILMVLGVLSLTGFISFATLTAQMVRWVFSSEQTELPLEVVGVQYSPDTSVTVDDWVQVKNKMHQFFKLAEQGKATQPITITQREFNAFLKHDKRLGPLQNAASLAIRKGRVQTIFDVNIGEANMLGKRDLRFRGVGTFRLGIHGRHLKVAVDNLKVNGNDVQKWMKYVKSANLQTLASNGLKSISQLPLALLGKGQSRSGGGNQSLRASFDISPDSTGQMFEAVSYGGSGAVQTMVERLQLYSINQVFSVHSRLHDLVLSLERVEIGDGFIKIYPRVA